MYELENKFQNIFIFNCYQYDDDIIIIWYDI